MYEYVLRSRRVVRPEGVGPAAILVRGGRIADVFPEARATPSLPLQSDVPVTDVGDSVVMPGLIDTHVHVNDPGPDGGEGFGAATRAAAAGGVTTLIDMPTGAPPTASRAALDRKGEAAAGRLRVDVGFWGGLVPDNVAELSPLRAAGVFGYKCYICSAGASGLPEVTDHDLLLATERLEETPLLVHATDAGSVARIVRLVTLSRTPVHVLHLCSADVVEAVRRAKEEGARVTAEVCPHHLVFAAGEIPAGAAGHRFTPPIRGREDREELWRGLREGTIDMVVSGHSLPAPRAGGQPGGDGISSLGVSLATTWTAARHRGFGLEDLGRWMSAAPARLAGLTPWKGAIAAGRNADFVVWNPEAEWTVDSGKPDIGGAETPWTGRSLAGVVEATYLKGRKIYERGQFLSTPRGEILLSG